MAGKGFKYEFTGEEPEDFLAFGRLNPGDTIESDEEVEHARLNPLTGKPVRAKDGE